jgi:hypothetical protein
MSDPQHIHVTLNPAGVVEPLQRIVIVASEVVSAAMNAIENGHLSPDIMHGGYIGYKFTGLELSDEERRETYRNWMLSKGFQDLARGVRETLEEALFYLRAIEMKSGHTTWGKLQGDLQRFRTNAEKLQFPKLLADVNSRLTEPMAFEEEFVSLQKARNCLEHRRGSVGSRDVNASTNTLTLSFPRLRMFYKRGNEEVEVTPGEAIDTHCDDNPFGGDEEVPIYMNRVTRSRIYELGESVVISSSDFVEIAMACQLFANDLLAKLPTLPATSAEEGE